MSKDTFEFKNWWKEMSAQDKEAVFSFSQDYVAFLNACKTEREVISYIEALCIKEGFQDMDQLITEGQKLIPGQKIYRKIRGKSMVLAIVGRAPAEQGLNMVGAHVDSPRLDFKQTPFYEDTDMALAKTHYYGGIKKYQWVCIPLALHGVVVLKSGKKVEIRIGDASDEPTFVITDLLPHLAQQQMNKKMSDGITGEGLNVLLGSMHQPKDSDEEEESGGVKAHLMALLKERYGVEESDFVSAEIEVVPAMPAQDVGFDRSMVGGYGQDDRICSYAALKALLQIEGIPAKTAVAYFSDKEEVGSMGNTGAQSSELSDFIAEYCAMLQPQYNDLLARRCIRNSSMLSADVAAAVDPNFKDAQDKYNACYFGRGVVLKKYTGARGKSGANDANPEFVAALRRLFDQHEIYWQSGELGKVDLGGGGTIAQFMANLGMQVIDCGVPVLSMHSPYEVASKADLYSAYKAYAAFLNEYRGLMPE